MSDWLLVNCEEILPSVLILPLSVVKELSNLRAFAVHQLQKNIND
jgi:hypothetical protein